MELATLSRELGAILAVDNCFCTPAFQQPLALRADIVTHSATKYLDGQGRVYRWRIGRAVRANCPGCRIQSCRWSDYERLQRLGDVERFGDIGSPNARTLR